MTSLPTPLSPGHQDFGAATGDALGERSHTLEGGTVADDDRHAVVRGTPVRIQEMPSTRASRSGSFSSSSSRGRRARRNRRRPSGERGANSVGPADSPRRDRARLGSHEQFRGADRVVPEP